MEGAELGYGGDLVSAIANKTSKTCFQGWSRGMVVGLIHDILSVKEPIDRIMAQAEGISRQRLSGMVEA